MLLMLPFFLGHFLWQVHGAWLPPWLATHAARSMVQVDLTTIHPLCLLFLTTLVVLLYRRWYQLTGTNMGNLPSTAYCRRCCVSSLLFLFKDENNDLNRFFICAFIPCEINNDRHLKNQHRQRNGLSPMWKLLRR